jgi:hypothetical protein
LLNYAAGTPPFCNTSNNGNTSSNSASGLGGCAPDSVNRAKRRVFNPSRPTQKEKTSCGETRLYRAVPAWPHLRGPSAPCQMVRPKSIHTPAGSAAARSPHAAPKESPWGLSTPCQMVRPKSVHTHAGSAAARKTRASIISVISVICGLLYPLTP